jgi:hypothetical protein
MRRKIWWILVLLGLPHVAAAEGMTGAPAAQALADHERAVARSETPVADLPPSLDLRILPPQASPSRSAPTVSRALGADRAHSADSADGPLSFGVELKRRRQLESRAWQDDENTPGLQDDLERLIDQSTLGVRGTYHF